MPLLLAMLQDELALKKAIESGDTDLGSFLINDHSVFSNVTYQKEVVCSGTF